MKKWYVLLILLVAGFSLQFANAQMTADDPVYIENISNESKTIDLTLGFYPKTYQWSESQEASQVTLRILNNSKKDYEWKNYKIYILLNDNSTLFYSYTTKATSGDYNCTYTIYSGDSHDQVMCFDKKFNVNDIKTVWVSFDTGIFFKLYFYQKE